MTRRIDPAEEKRLLDGLDRSVESRRPEPRPPIQVPPIPNRVETAGGAFMDDGSGHYTPESGEPPEMEEPGPMLLSGEGTLDLAPGLSLPPDAVTQTFGVLAKRGAGKALALDTPIPVPDGWSTMGNVVVGDRIFDEKGRVCHVVEATEVMLDHKCYEVEFDDGTSIVADADHLWLVHDLAYRRAVALRRLNRKKGLKGRKNLPAQCVPRHFPRLITTEEMSRAVDVKFTSGLSAKNYAVPSTEPLDLRTASLPVPPYVLGVWLGDGIAQSASVVTADVEILEHLEEEGYSVSEVRSQRRSGCSTYRIGMGPVEKKLHTELREAGLLLNKHVPAAYLRGSARQRHDLVAGLMDTDGTVCKGKNECEFANTNKQIVDSFYELVVSLGWKARVSSKIPVLNGVVCSECWTVRFRPMSSPFRLSRKSRKLDFGKSQSSRFERRMVTRVTLVPSVPVRCIVVDSPSHLFLAGRSMVPTHNSYTAMVMCEEMIKQGYPVVILDPTGAWWGLRTGADGRSAGYPVMILGGEHGDLPLPVGAGKKIARLVVGRRFQWLLVDLSKLMPDDQHRFVFDFCGTLYHENRDAIHLFVDEADEFVPQKPADSLEHKVFGVMDRIVRRGRLKGIGITLISQRSAVINKNVLSQVEVLVALRTIAPPDLDAIESWTKRNISKEERERFMTSLPRLRIGDAWFISPAWLGIFKRVSVRRRITFDSSATPKVGEKRVLPDKVASVDIESVRALLAEVEEVDEDGGGEHLVAKIAELEAKLREAGSQRPKIAKSDLSVIEAGSRKVDEASKRLAKLGEDARAIVAAIQPLLDEIEGASRSLAEKADAVSSLADGPELLGPIPAAGEPDNEEEDEDDSPSGDEANRKPRRSPGSRAKGDGIPSTPVRILRALASIERPLSSLEIGVLSGVRYAGGSFSERLGEARDEGFVTQNEDDNRYKITLKGVAHLTKLGALPSEPPSWPETLALWKRGRIGLKPRQIEIVELVIGASGKGMTRVEIAEKLGVVASGGSFQEYISDLVAAGLLIEKEGRRVAPNPVLLPDLPF